MEGLSECQSKRKDDLYTVMVSWLSRVRAAVLHKERVREIRRWSNLVRKVHGDKGIRALNTTLFSIKHRVQ